MFASRPYPPHFAIVASDATFEIPPCLRRPRFTKTPVHLSAILGQHVLQKYLIVPYLQLWVSTKNACMFLCSMRCVIGQIEIPSPYATHFQGEVQSGLALAQNLFRLLARRVVGANKQVSACAGPTVGLRALGLLIFSGIFMCLLPSQNDWKRVGASQNFYLTG